MYKKYTLTKEKCETFKGLVILNAMINQHTYFNIVGNNDDKYLNDLMATLIAKGLIRIDCDKYVPTEKGRENLLNFYKKYWEFVRMFQLYGAVDLENGVFAYAEYWNMSQEQFDDYLQSKPWEDVRIAVAEFKGIDPGEIVFMHFLNTDCFDISSKGWQIDLVSDMIWDNIVNICCTAIHKEELEADDAIKNIIIAGSELLVNLYKEEDAQRKALDAEEAINELNKTQTVVETVYVDEIIEEYYEPDYYYPYMYDPFYVSPCWGVIIY